MPRNLKGSCLCGRVHYRLGVLPKAVSHCHCSLCRKGHGAAFATYASVPRYQIRVDGAEHVRTYESSPGVLRSFCEHCGSALFWSRSEGELAGWISVALGTLDTDFEVDSQRHRFAEELPSWSRAIHLPPGEGT